MKKDHECLSEIDKRKKVEREEVLGREMTDKEYLLEKATDDAFPNLQEYFEANCATKGKYESLRKELRKERKKAEEADRQKWELNGMQAEEDVLEKWLTAKEAEVDALFDKQKAEFTEIVKENKYLAYDVFKRFYHDKYDTYSWLEMEKYFEASFADEEYMESLKELSSDIKTAAKKAEKQVYWHELSDDRRKELMGDDDYYLTYKS